ncbi:MAG: outer membrane beta-barrel protein [Pontibacterium sp.]
MKIKLIRTAVVSVAGVCATTASAIEPAGFGAGFVDLIPTLSIQTGYDDNIYGDETGAKGSFTSVISPNLLIAAEKDNDSYSVNYNMAIGTTYSSHVDDYVDHNLSGSAQLELDSRNRLTLGANLGRIHESGPNNGDAPAYFVDHGISAGYGFGAEGAKGNIEGSFAYQSHDTLNYHTENAGDVRENLLLGGKFLYRVAPKTKLVTEGRIETADYEQESTTSLDNTSLKFLGGVAWEATAKTAGEAKIGFVNKDFDSTLTDRDSFTWEIGATWSPLSYSNFGLSTSQAFNETDGDLIDSATYSLTWDHTWSDVVSTNVAYSLTNDDYLDAGRKDDTNSFTVGANYELKRWLSVGVGYTHTDVESTLAGSSSTKNVVSLTLQGSL